MLVGTKRFEKGGTSIKGRAIGGWEAYVGLGIIRVIRQGDDNLCTTRPDMTRPSYAIKKEGLGEIDKSKKRGEACTCRDLIMVITGIESSRSLGD